MEGGIDGNFTAGHAPFFAVVLNARLLDNAACCCNSSRCNSCLSESQI